MIYSYCECMSYVALEDIKNQNLDMTLVNQEAQTRPYHYISIM